MDPHTYFLVGNLLAGGTTNMVSVTATANAGAPTPSGNGTWLSGASGDGVADGSYGKWRNAPVGIIGTWQFNPADTFDPGKEFGNWYGNVDLGYGSYIYRDDYAQAASGSADSRWIKTLQYIENRWKGKGSYVYMRLAYEFNGAWMSNWNVNNGQQQDFINAWLRFRGLQRQYAPTTVKLVWCPTNNHNGPLTYSCWPGLEYADVVGVRVATEK